ncbi:MAG: hypothetical protein ACI4I9_02200 [Porcipelethomonas sp.]
MRKIFKQEHVNKTSGTVIIPDAVFEIPVFDSAEEAGVTDRPIVTREMYNQIEETVRAEIYGKLDAEKLEVQKQCDEMLSKAQADADEIIRNARTKADQITDSARSEADNIKLEAYNTGKRQGLEEKSEMLAELSKNISDSLTEIKSDENEYFEKYAVELKHLAVEMAEKIICQRIEDDDLFMYNIVKSAVKSLRDVPWVKVEIAGRLLGYIDSLEEELSYGGHRVEFIVRENVPNDICVLNHSNGVVIATLSEQLKNLKEFIQNIDKGGNDENEP